MRTKKRQRILKQFIRECEQKGLLKPDYGLIHSAESVNEQGQTTWQMWAQTQFEEYIWIAPFQGHCTDCIAPIAWTRISNHLVLRYDHSHRDTLTKDESKCLREILRGHVALNSPLAPPPKQVPELDPQGRPVLDKYGKPKMWEYSWPIGSTKNSTNTIITFIKDGSFQKGLAL
ncbi:hypothetical protein [Spirosoma aerophilum]